MKEMLEEKENLKIKKSLKKQKLREKGITLIALVVTIIILLILAGVTLTIALGQNGLFQRAKYAGEKYKEAEEDEKEILDGVVQEIDKILPPKTLKEAIEKKYIFNNNTEIKDEYNNLITIPAGFHVVPDGTCDVEYKYSTNEDGSETNIPTVQDGIVIEDGEGNQFVWIPVGIINNKENDEKNEATTEIKLGRYTFVTDGTPSEAYNGSTILDYYIEENAEEHKSSRYGNAIAKDIEGFKKSAEENHGYYIGRYEAGVTNYDSSNIETRNNSNETNWTGYKDKSEMERLKVVCKQGQQVWNIITQNKASEIARKMYEGKTFTSDLINSYVWDTTIIFIQKYSENTGYSRMIGHTFSTSLRSTGSTEGNADRVCNVFDMSSNCLEWTTETYKSIDSPCCRRGDSFLEWNDYTSYRHGDSFTNSYR